VQVVRHTAIGFAAIVLENSARATIQRSLFRDNRTSNPNVPGSAIAAGPNAGVSIFNGAFRSLVVFGDEGSGSGVISGSASIVGSSSTTAQAGGASLA